MTFLLLLLKHIQILKIYNSYYHLLTICQTPCFTYIISNSHDNTARGLLFFQYFSYDRIGSEELSNLPKVTQLICG